MRQGTVAVIGLLIAPLIASLSMFAPAWLSENNLASPLVFVLVGYIYALIVELVLGVPLLLLCWYFDSIRWWTAVGSGAIVGFAFINLIARPDLAGVLQFSSIGAISGLSFWLVWRLGLKQDAAK